MSFLDIRFPQHISYGSRGGPQFKTTVLALYSGFEKRNIDWEDVVARYDAQHGIKDREQMEELLNFFMIANGRAYSWRYRDPLDNTLTNVTIGTGTGAKTVFQLIKRYSRDTVDALSTIIYDRTITKPVQGTLTGVTVNGVAKSETTHYTVNWSTGEITFLTPPGNGHAVVVGSCTFDVHCRFDTDHFDITHDFWETMSWPSIPIVEVKGTGADEA